MRQKIFSARLQRQTDISIKGFSVSRVPTGKLSGFQTVTNSWRTYKRAIQSDKLRPLKRSTVLISQINGLSISIQLVN